MLFNTLHYIVFLPAVTAVYYLLPHRWRYIWLFLASYYFYMQWNPKYILLLFSSTAVTYAGALILTRVKERAARRLVLAVCLLINLSVLGYFKYAEFALGLLNRVRGIAGAAPLSLGHSILLPVGISFFTLQALGYLIDVYRGDVPAERNFIRYALFVSFFPQLVAGPIERSKNLMHQLSEKHTFTYDAFREGLLLILYGLFLKMVIADRASVIADTVYADPAVWPGFYVAFATVVFGIQIYCDFYGYSVIAAGSARLMGIRLMSNFEAPFLSASIQEVWRRWHISLSTWFRDYLYIPLGGSRKGKARKALNILIVFTVSGLWHGAALSFVFWGFLNGLYQVVGEYLPEKRKTLPGARLVTFLLFAVTLVFFRAGGMRPAVMAYRSLFSAFNPGILTDGSLALLGLSMRELKILLGAVLVLMVTDLLKYLGLRPAERVYSLPGPVRYLVYAGLFFAILLYGCYGDTYDAQQFIYFQF